METANDILSGTISEFYYFANIIGILRGICKSDVSLFAESEFSRLKLGLNSRERRVIDIYLGRKSIMDKSVVEV